MNFDFFVSLLFPRKCLACGKALLMGVICDTCFGTISIGTPSMVSQFQYFMGAAASYENRALQALIHALKFRGIRAAAEPIADILATYILPIRKSLREYSIVPVPLSSERLRTRGFNQAERIAASLGNRLALPVANKILMRTKHTKPQTDTSNTFERKNNVRDCFAITEEAMNSAAVPGKRFILIDDVTTTGATLLEAARALSSARAAHVIALAAAKA